MKITPSCTSGADSFCPLGSVQPQATRSSPTLVRLICLRGLKPYESYVRRHVSHSPSGGLTSIASVTGRVLSSGLTRGGGGGIVTPAESPPPSARGAAP